jgi:hypothetical protein
MLTVLCAAILRAQALQSAGLFMICASFDNSSVFFFAARSSNFDPIHPQVLFVLLFMISKKKKKFVVA